MLEDNKKKSLLFVSHDHDLVEKVQKEIENDNTRIVTANNVTEARLKIGYEEFSFIILDMEMAGIKPLNFVESIRSKEQRRGVKDHLPIILFGNNPALFQKDFTRFDLTSFLEKPLNLEELKTKLAVMGKTNILKEHTREVQKNTVLVLEGSSSTEMYWVLKGTFVATKKSGDEDDEEQIIGKIGPGELIGEMSFLDSMDRSATVIALESSEVLVIPHKKFLAAVDDQPRWLQALMKTLSMRLRNSNDIIGQKEQTIQDMSEIKAELEAVRQSMEDGSNDIEITKTEEVDEG